MAIRCYLVAIGNDLTLSPELVLAKRFDPAD